MAEVNGEALASAGGAAKVEASISIADWIPAYAGMTAGEAGMVVVNGKASASAGGAYYLPLTTPQPTTLPPTTPPPATPPPSFPSVSVRCRVAAYGHLPSGIQSLFVGDASLPSVATGFPHPPLTHCGGRPAGMTAVEAGMAEVGMLAEEMGMAATDGRALAGAGGAAKDEVSAGIVDWIPAYAGMTAEKAGMTAAGMLAEEMGMTATDGKTLAGASGAFYPPLTTPPPTTPSPTTLPPTTPSPATPPPSFPSVSVRCRVAAYGHLPSGIQCLFVGDGGLPSVATGFPHPPLTHCGGRPAGMTAEEAGMTAVNSKALASAGGAANDEASISIADWIPAYAGMTAREAGMTAVNGKALASAGGAYYPPLTTPPPTTPPPTTPSPATPPPSFPSVSVRCRVAAYGHLPSGIQSLFVGDASLPSVATGFPHPAGMTAGDAGMAAVGMLADEMGMTAADGKISVSAGGAAKVETSTSTADWIPAYAGMTAGEAGMVVVNGKASTSAGGAYYLPLTTPQPTTLPPTTPSPATPPPSFPSVSARCRVAAYGHLPSGIQSLCVGDGGLPSMATGFPHPPLTHCGGRPAGMTAAGIVDWIPACAGMTAEEAGNR